MKRGECMRLEKGTSIKDVLKIICPGTQLREGIENILRAKTGGLLVLGDSNEILNIVDGGFNINAEYSPSYVYELAKMDGAIVISSDLKKIVRANAQLIPNSSTQTYETGSIKYVLRDSSVIITKANQAIQTLEKYVSVLDRVIDNLNLLEFQDLVTLFDVVTSVQRTEMVMRIVSEIERYICELGNEGRLIYMQLNELIKNIERDGLLLISLKL